MHVTDYAPSNFPVTAPSPAPESPPCRRVVIPADPGEPVSYWVRTHGGWIEDRAAYQFAAMQRARRAALSVRRFGCGKDLVAPHHQVIRESDEGRDGEIQRHGVAAATLVWPGKRDGHVFGAARIKPPFRIDFAQRADPDRGHFVSFPVGCENLTVTEAGRRGDMPSGGGAGC